MKKIILSMAMLAMVGATATAQKNNDGLTPSRPLTSGELFQGMSRAIPTGRVVLPYGLDVTFDKTVHLIFPSAIRYVDLGSQNIIAGKAEDAENVLRVKASVKDFETETNMSVICEDGSFYTFNVKYADEPEKLSIEMKDFLSPTDGRLPSNRSDIYFKELGNESPVLVKLMMQTIYQNDKRTIKHIGAQQFGMKFLLRGLYAHNGLLYFHILKKEFMLRHVMIGTLLLHNERYKWLNDIFLYTHSEPEYYGLIPSTFIEIVEMLENIDSICTSPAFQQQNFYFADEMGGVNDEKFIFRKAIKYLSLLVIRLWTLQHRNFDDTDSLSQIPFSPILIEDDERMATLMEMMKDDVEEFYSKEIFQLIPRLLPVDKADILSLLSDYRDQCLNTKETHQNHPDVDCEKFSKLKEEIMSFVNNFNIALPQNNIMAEVDNLIIKEDVVETKERLETLYYSPYKNIGLCEPPLLTNFMFELYRVYLRVLDSMRKLASYKINRSQIQGFLEKIEYNDLNYAIITTDNIYEIENPYIGLCAGIRPFGFFIMKKEDIPYVSFGEVQKDDLKITIAGSSIRSNIDSFIDCHEAYFNLVMATKMFVHIKEKTDGVVYVSINEEYPRQENPITINATLADLFDN